MRLNIFEQIKNAEIDYAQEMKRIDDLFAAQKVVPIEREGWMGPETYYISLKTYIEDNLFLNWKFRGNFLSIDDLCSSLHISNNYFRNNQLETMLNHFEFIWNMLLLFNNSNNSSSPCKCINIIKQNISNTLDKINYKIQEIDNIAIIIEKDPKAIAIAELYEDVSDTIIEYRRFAIQGNIDRKKEILSTLSKKIEAIESNLKQNQYSYLVDEVTGLLNSLDIRHNNKEGKHAHEKIIEMKSEELEDWCDKTYDTILLALMVNHYLDYKNDIKSLNKEIKVKK